PGRSCLRVRHAAELLDRVDEVHVARHGAAGPGCARQRLRALRGTALDWRDGEWVRRPGFSGRELSWFPDPIGARDCYRAALADPLVLVPALAGVRRVTARLAANRRDRALAPFPVLWPPPVEGGLGAVRVELRGDRGGVRQTVVYGVLDRPAVAGAATAAVAALAVSAGDQGTGASGVAGMRRSTPMLIELARRGVRAAVFEGALAAPLAITGPEPDGTLQDSVGMADRSHEE
ncbi:MAG: saccharopine dehydrogenase family protein, partial [Microthrixaceae bacterium]